MNRKYAILAAALLTLAAGSARAQVRFGPQLAYGDDTDFAVGARVLFGLASMMATETPDLDGLVSLNYYLDPGNVDGYNVWDMDAAVAWNFVPTETVAPYARGGLNLTHWSWDRDGGGPGPGEGRSGTDLGVGLGGGIRFVLGTLGAFADGQITLGGAEQFVLTFGLLFGDS